MDAPVISIDPSAEQDGVYYVDSDFSISWSADGDVAAYFLRITDGNTDFANGQVDYSSTSISLSNLADGVTYEVTVTAIPVNGTVDDGQSATLRFAKAAPQVGVVDAPVISIDPSAEQDGVYYVDSDFSISWSADGDVAAYFLRITDGNTDFANGQVDYSSTSISLSNLADGVTYEVTVNRHPRQRHRGRWPERHAALCQGRA